jgi:tetratricopeptide (TPR) repeat protein
MPTIFISYSHDSAEHAARVLALADRLIEDGLDCVLDQYIGDPPEGWPRWMDRKIKEADLVIMICTETYYKRVMGEEKKGVGLGVKWEGNLIYQHLYQNETVNEKFIPVLFEDGKFEHIPTPVQGQTFYRLDSQEAYDRLYWRLTGQHQTEKPKKGQIKKRPSRKRGSLFKDVPHTSSFASPVPQASPLALPEVSLGGLPVTGPDLFGREKELAQLDAAWENPQTNLFVLVAWGGVGKTSLVNKWLFDNMAKENYRGAQRVFGWSFYSQGAGEGKQASADRFVADALRWFGDQNPDEGDPIDKGKRLAALIKQQKTLLVLDGLEPLQYPPGSEEGRLKDRGLGVLLRELAAQNPGLCLITTRLPVNDLKNFFGSSVENMSLTHLSPEAGAQVLSNLGVLGTEKELKQAVEEFDGHALALNLLGTYLSTVYDGDVLQWDKIPQLVYAEERQGQHARRVMESYERWFAETEKGRRELQILRIMGLFDRPADLGAIEALLAEPVIPGLTDGLHLAGGVHLRSSPEWKFAIKDLQELRLLAKPHCLNHDSSDFYDYYDKASSSAHHQKIKEITQITQITVLDAHPLVREHFGEKLQQEQPEAWKEAHSRLYEYYKNLPEKELPDTLEEMEPLFAAVTHGCLAGLHTKVWEEVYWKRIKRENEHYNTRKLGAFGSDLVALSNFFEELWSRPAAELAEADKAVALNQAGFVLRAMGRLWEATQPIQACIEFDVSHERWGYATIAAGNLSELWLTLGEVAQAVEVGRQSVEFADHIDNWFEQMEERTTLAEALHQADNFIEAEKLFRKAEEIQQKEQPESPYLYSLQGFRFCDLLLSLGQYQEVQQRAKHGIKVAEESNFGLLDFALDRLSLGRAFLLQSFDFAQDDRHGELCHPVRIRRRIRTIAQAAQYLDQAVAGLREAGQQQYLPLGLLARAAFFRVTHQFDKARADLNEVHEIAARGEMRLFLTDYHLEAGRLRLAELSLPLDSRSLADSGSLLSSAREHVEKAAKLIEKTGYHRRDREVEELQGFLISKDFSV